jgi:peptide/nickel transport system permease protein
MAAYPSRHNNGCATSFHKDVTACMSSRPLPHWYRKLLGLCGIFLAVGVLPHVIPGPPLVLYESWPSRAQQRALLINEYGLDRSVPVQYAIWLRRTMTGHWGHSRFHYRPVFPETLHAMTFTLVLILWVALVCLVCIVVWSGLQWRILPSCRPPWHAKSLVIAAVFPTFLVAIVLHDIAVWQFGWFRLANPLHFKLSHLLNPLAMLLPSCVLAVPPLLVWHSCGQGASRGPASTLGERLSARWRSFCQLFYPLLASFLLEMLLVEHVMALPGLGRLGIEALKRRDFPLLQGFLLWGGVLYLVLSLILELGAGLTKRTPVEPQQHSVRPASPQSIRLGLYGGMWGLLVLLALAICTAQLLPYDPTEIHRYDQLLRPGSRYVLGTDFLGRDVLSRTLQGFRSALPRVLLLTLLIGSVAGGIHWLARWLPKACRLPGVGMLALFDALPPFLLAFMVFLVVEHRSRPLETTLTLACLPIAGQLIAYRASLPLQYMKLSYLAAHLLLLELIFFFLNLSPESLTPTWGSDIRLGMHYNHINVWLVIAPALAFTWSRYIFYHLGMYASLRTTYDVQEVSLA